MIQKEKIDATWDDMDWGQSDPSRMVPMSVAARVEEKPSEAVSSSSPLFVAPLSAVDALVEQARLRNELVCTKAELLEQQRMVTTPPSKAVEMLLTSPAEQDPSAGYLPPASGAAVVFNPQTLATLKLVSEGGHETLVTVRDSYVVGRNKGCCLVIRDLHVSSQHAKFTLGMDGMFVITDLNSSGGTFVNGTRIERCVLKNGDKIEFATVPATFRYVAGGLLDPQFESEGTLVHSKVDAARKLAAFSHAPRHGLLTVLMADEKSLDVPVGGQITIGRAQGNDLMIAEEHVSSRHARLAGNGGGGFELFDLGSSCGTFVNGVQVQHWVLNHGDRIRFGIVESVFMIVDPNGQSPPVTKFPPLRNASALPQVEDSGATPMPQPKPAFRKSIPAIG